MKAPTKKKTLQPDMARLRRIIHEHLPELRQRYSVTSLGIFGSYVRGEQRPGSDLDLLVEFGNPHLSLLKLIEMENYLTDLLGIKVDLVEKSGLRPRIGERILQEVEPV